MTIIDSAASLITYVFGNLAPYHLLFYSTLLGTELYQTFLNTKVCYLALPRSAFTTLQKRLFPIYFRGQTILLLLTAVTFPPHGVFSLVKHKADWLPFTLAGVTAVLNLVVYGPRTQKAMVDCIHQETRDAQLRLNGGCGEENMPSLEMQRLRKVFSRNHAMAIHLNLISIGAMVFYGWRFASRLGVDVA
ncbi:hypothetical protein C8A03DRAFT_19725 [Achaetomium macrosporum]|uniref:TMEM205-like domain-containing protein n=1 Tax=Achaetomium macrosporum TaxID=79813 RepID=A0AAN7H6L5_9PEZI|nr:hypothetical protein C8A03DRAFT_19725 [Achaetomium macrosporum]